MGSSREAIGLMGDLTRLPLSLLRSSRPGLLKLVSLHPEDIRCQDPACPVFCPCFMALPSSGLSETGFQGVKK